jgi:6-phosphogluconolactonase
MAFPNLSTPAWTGVVLGLLCSFAVLGETRASAAEPAAKSDKLWAFVGTYTNKGSSKGIYQFDLDPATGKLTPRGLAAEVANPSFVAIHPNHRFLYAVSEVNDASGKKGGAVTAFAIDPKTGCLTRLNHELTGGNGPCHLVVDKQGKNVLVANYGSGCACVLPIHEDGKLGEATDSVQHHGSSVDKDRQEGPHAHSINLDPSNRFAFVADLGLDKVMVYRFDPAKGTIKPNDPPSAAVAPGSGPRHFAFHPNGRFAYVINEMKSTITPFAYDAEHGVLKPLHSVSTLPKEGFSGETTTAEVQVHPSGKFLYGSNRGHDSIAVFTIDPQTGELTPAGHQGKDIKTPRNFGIDPTGKFLIVANQDSDSLVVFRIDPQTGELTPTGEKVECPMPVCVKMMPAGR